MGATHSVEMYPDMGSEAQPGTDAITSASLDQLNPPCTAMEVIDEFLMLVRYPVDPTAEAVLKSVHIEEKGPDDFIVKVVLDGKKLDGYGHGRGDGMDKVRNWKRVVVDRSKRCLTTEDFVDDTQGCWADEASDPKVFCKTTMHVLQNPARLEFLVDQDGKRIANAAVRDILYVWTDAIVDGIQQAKTAKVKVAAGAPSIKVAGQTSNVSEPMEKHVRYEKFFPALVFFIKDGLQKNPANAIIDISESEFASEGTVGEEGKEKEMRTAVRFSQDLGDIEMTFVQDGALVRTTYYTVHKSHLVVEGWGVEPDGTRIVGEATARQMQKLINQAIAKATSWFG